MSVTNRVLEAHLDEVTAQRDRLIAALEVHRNSFNSLARDRALWAVLDDVKAEL